MRLCANTSVVHPRNVNNTCFPHLLAGLHHIGSSCEITLHAICNGINMTVLSPLYVEVQHDLMDTLLVENANNDVEISNFPISLRDGLVINVSFVCEFKGSSRAPGGWNNDMRHTNDVLQARANVKNKKYKDVYGLVRP